MHHPRLRKIHEWREVGRQTQKKNSPPALYACGHLRVAHEFSATSEKRPIRHFPSNSSHTTSPVLGQMAIIPMLTRSSAPMPPRSCSTRHINNGASFGSTSSTESMSSTYLRAISIWWHNLKHGTVSSRYGGVKMRKFSFERSITVLANFL
jgi:hypothetical protein